MAKKKALKKEPEQVTEQLIDDWQEAKNLRKQWEEKELQLRVKICDLLTPDVHSGTHRFEKFGFEMSSYSFNIFARCKNQKECKNRK